MENTKAFARINDKTNLYFKGEEELVKRVNFVRNVVKNTLRKFPRAIWPEELTQLFGGSNTRLMGFEFIERDSYGNIKAQDGIGLEMLTHNHELHFYIVGARSWQDNTLAVRKASIPASLLFNDPIAIAQYARKLIRKNQEKIQQEKENNAYQEMRKIAVKMEELEQKRKKLESERTEANKLYQLSKEKNNQKKEKLNQRRAAKLLKENS